MIERQHLDRPTFNHCCRCEPASVEIQAVRFNIRELKQQPGGGMVTESGSSPLDSGALQNRGSMNRASGEHHGVGCHDVTVR